MAETPRVKVTCTDPTTGDTETQELDPNGYVLICGENMYVDNYATHANGTVQLTLKRVK